MLSDETTYSDPVVTFDWTGSDTVSGAVIAAISEVTGEQPEDLDPLFNAVDPDCLDGIFTPTSYSQARLNGGVEFEYNGYWIVVRANGQGYVYPLEPAIRQDPISAKDGANED